MACLDVVVGVRALLLFFSNLSCTAGLVDTSIKRNSACFSCLLQEQLTLSPRISIIKKEQRGATTSWKRTRQARLGSLHIPGFISQGLPPHAMFDVLDLVWDLLKTKNVYRTGPIR
jgi:hypothetical protein